MSRERREEEPLKKLTRLLIFALVAGAIATLIVQRQRLQQIDREQLANQIREGTTQVTEAIQAKFDRGGDEAATEAVEAAAEAAAETDAADE